MSMYGQAVVSVTYVFVLGRISSARFCVEGQSFDVRLAFFAICQAGFHIMDFKEKTNESGCCMFMLGHLLCEKYVYAWAFTLPMGKKKR